MRRALVRVNSWIIIGFECSTVHAGYNHTNSNHIKINATTLDIAFAVTADSLQENEIERWFTIAVLHCRGVGMGWVGLGRG